MLNDAASSTFPGVLEQLVQVLFLETAFQEVLIESFLQGMSHEHVVNLSGIDEALEQMPGAPGVQVLWSGSHQLCNRLFALLMHISKVHVPAALMGCMRAEFTAFLLTEVTNYNSGAIRVFLYLFSETLHQQCDGFICSVDIASAPVRIAGTFGQFLAVDQATIVGTSDGLALLFRSPDQECDFIARTNEVFFQVVHGPKVLFSNIQFPGDSSDTVPFLHDVPGFPFGPHWDSCFYAQARSDLQVARVFGLSTVPSLKILNRNIEAFRYFREGIPFLNGIFQTLPRLFVFLPDLFCWDCVQRTDSQTDQ